MKTFLIAFVFLATFGSLSHADDALLDGFQNPPAAAKARTWWHWINGNVSKAGITADLEAMKKVGIQETQLFNVDLKDPKGPATYLSPQWLDLLKHAANESKRLGLELGFHNGPGWSSSGGPWVTPEHAMQTVVFSTTTHVGGAPLDAALPQPNAQLDYYRDIAVLAFPTPKTKQRIDNLDYKILSGRIRNHLAPDTKLIPATAIVDKSEIVNLTAMVTADGVLKWDAPQGEWTILRIGHTPNGQRNRPAPAGGRGLECDKMSRAAVDAYWEGGIGPIIEELGPLIGSVVTNCVIDSYEVGTTNWTSGFEKEFERRRGYDCTSFLPTLAGYYVDSGEVSERFLWDLRRTVGDMIADNYYAHFRDLCHQHGMKLSVEPYWGPFDNMQVGAAGDIVMCEFWSGDIAFFDSPKFVASIAKLNGDSIVGAEAFTGEGGWTQHPATIKSIGDRAWAQGINRFIFHSYVHQPWDVGPGLTLSYHGLEFHRLNTWWEQGAAFLDYVARGQFLLQQGTTVADVLVFTGESSPNTGLLMPELKALGYDYDLVGANKLESLSVKDGLIQTSAGATYRALVLPKTTWMRPQTLRKFGQLANAGATVLGPRPQQSPSLQGYPKCDDEVALLAEKLWDAGTIKDASVIDLLRADSVAPDFSGETDMPAGVVFSHRRSGETDIYFLANAQKESRQETCRFRVTGKQPELWNAQTGEIKDATVWKENTDGTTSVSIELEREGSVFVIFRKPAKTPAHITQTEIDLNLPPAVPLRNLEILDARYGTFLQPGLIDITETLNDKITDNRLVTVAHRGLCDYDPAPGYKKELRVQYKIGDTVKSTSVIETETLSIDGGDQGKLVLLNAVFGKFAKGAYGPSGLPPVARSKDVTEKVAALVDAGVFEIPVNDEMMGGEKKQDSGQSLQVKYSTDGELRHSSARPGTTLNLFQRRAQSSLVAREGEVYWSTPHAGQMTYGTSTGQTNTVQVESVPAPINLTGPWQVTFPVSPIASKGPNNAVVKSTFEKLSSWSSSTEDGIRYFSGTATYQKQFDLPSDLLRPEVELELDLGGVAVIAEVVVNGKNLGVLWKAPFRVSLAGVVNEGANTLEVNVTNLWPNRLIGDAHLPNDIQRKGRGIKQWPDWLLNQTDRTSGRVGLPAYKHWNKDSSLNASGRLGPVIIRPYVHVKTAK